MRATNSSIFVECYGNLFFDLELVCAGVDRGGGCGNCAVSPPMMPAGGSSAGCVSRTGRCGSSSPCCCSCRASTASANFDADADLPVFFSGNGRPQAVPFAFSPGSLPGDFFSGRRDRGRNGGESRVNDKLSRRLSSPNAGRMGCLMGILYVNRYFVCNFNKCAVNNKLLT